MSLIFAFPSDDCCCIVQSISQSEIPMLKQTKTKQRLTCLPLWLRRFASLTVKRLSLRAALAFFVLVALLLMVLADKLAVLYLDVHIHPRMSSVVIFAVSFQFSHPFLNRQTPLQTNAHAITHSRCCLSTQNGTRNCTTPSARCGKRPGPC